VLRVCAHERVVGNGHDISVESAAGAHNPTFERSRTSEAR
jgi:hypothetical protein